ncbi:group I intron-associated PD-(D/E)XK endonuclease [Pedobacter miscanthi]|uniref:group I intron-associated PD-(D/E)XK endonuclease n=1 Tax=Pedobacter miscanthi TaxID=2259170 RepID=UPI00292EA703|nr:group I intron-associated PD-(D/E)XK endonuclease [Pedobacter miscanthi]
MSIKLEKSQTGIAAEFYAAGELSRLGYNVTVTFGNTKSIDLLIQMDKDIFKVQVKGIQATSSICWNLDKTKVTSDIYYVLVNLHVDQPALKPEFFVLTGNDALLLFKDTPRGGTKRTYLDYKSIFKQKIYRDRWHIFGSPFNVEEAYVMETLKPQQHV